MNEMKEAYSNAYKEFCEKYPHKTDIKLKFDPKIFIEEYEKDRKKKKTNVIQAFPYVNNILPMVNQERPALRDNNWNNFVNQQNINPNVNARPDFQNIIYQQQFPRPLAREYPFMVQNPLYQPQ